MTDSHEAALHRLRAFRGRWSDTDLIDQQSGLTASDLDQILAALGRSTDLDEVVFAAETLSADRPHAPDHFVAGFEAFAEGGSPPVDIDDAARELWREGFEHARAATEEAVRGNT